MLDVVYILYIHNGCQPPVLIKFSTPGRSICTYSMVPSVPTNYTVVTTFVYTVCIVNVLVVVVVHILYSVH